MNNQRKTSVERYLELRDWVDNMDEYTYKNPDTYVPLEIENTFLEYILAFEDSTIIPVYRLLEINPEDFSDDSTLTDMQINEKLIFLNELFNKHHIVVDFLNYVPKRLAYRHIRDLLFADMELIPDMTLHFDDCDGICENCWQVKWCESGKKMMKEWRKED